MRNNRTTLNHRSRQCRCLRCFYHLHEASQPPAARISQTTPIRLFREHGPRRLQSKFSRSYGRVFSKIFYMFYILMHRTFIFCCPTKLMVPTTRLAHGMMTPSTNSMRGISRLRNRLWSISCIGFEL